MNYSKKHKGYSLLQLAKMSAELPDIPGALDDISLSQILMELLVVEQLNISVSSAAILLGLAKTLMSRAIINARLPAHVDGNGRPVYTTADIATLTGNTPEVVQAGIAAMRSELGNDAVDKLIVDPKTVSSLH